MEEYYPEEEPVDKYNPYKRFPVIDPDPPTKKARRNPMIIDIPNP